MYAVIIFLIAYMIFSTILDLVYFIADEDNNYEEKHKQKDSTYLMIDGSISIIDFLVDVFMFKKFLSLYFYFFGLMEKKLTSQNEKMTSFNKAIFCWGLFLTLLTFVQTLLALLEKLIITDDMQKVELRFERFFLPIKDFFVYSTMLYLFYYQAI